MSRHTALPAIVIGVILFFIGIGTAAAVFANIPDAGSPPAIFDDFQWSSTANGYWHVNAIGTHAAIKDGFLTLKGADIELDRRVQTDPYTTVVSAKVRGIDFKRFGIGLGIYHSGTLGLEFDTEGIKCGFGSDYGYQVLFVKHWPPTPPVKQWFYLQIKVTNPYPDPREWSKVNSIPDQLRRKIGLTCSAYDSSGHLIGQVIPTVPPPNAHYNALDEVYIRTWDSHNKYQVDWVYAGPPSGDPLNAIVRAGTPPKPAQKPTPKQAPTSAPTQGPTPVPTQTP